MERYKFDSLTKSFAIRPMMSYFGLFELTINPDRWVTGIRMIGTQLLNRASDYRGRHNTSTNHYYVRKICDAWIGRKTSAIGKLS